MTKWVWYMNRNALNRLYHASPCKAVAGHACLVQREDCYHADLGLRFAAVHSMARLVVNLYFQIYKVKVYKTVHRRQGTFY